MILEFLWKVCIENIRVNCMVVGIVLLSLLICYVIV